MSTIDAHTPDATPAGTPPPAVHALNGDATVIRVDPPPRGPVPPAREQERDRRLVAAIDELGLTPIQGAYLHERWMGQLRYLGQSARRAQRRYYALRLVAILGGVTIPALIGLDVSGNREIVQWTAFALGLLVAAAVALEEFFRFGDRWRHFRQQSELLRSEGWMYLEGAGRVYRRYDSHAEGFRAFVDRAEEAMRQEVGVYVSEVARAPEDARGAGARSGTAPPAPPASHRQDERSAPAE